MCIWVDLESFCRQLSAFSTTHQDYDTSSIAHSYLSSCTICISFVASILDQTSWFDGFWSNILIQLFLTAQNTISKITIWIFPHTHTHKRREEGKKHVDFQLINFFSLIGMNFHISSRSRGEKKIGKVIQLKHCASVLKKL